MMLHSWVIKYLQANKQAQKAPSSRGRAILVLSVGIFLNKVAMVLFLGSLFQLKQRGCCLADVGGQKNVEITQHPKTVSVRAGHNLTITCILSEPDVLGPVRWYKRLGIGKVVTLKDMELADLPHVKVIQWSNTNVTLNFQNILPEDAGPYNCLKFSAVNPEEQLGSGKGTEVFVITKPSQPVVHGPTGSIMAGSRATFNCSTEGFFPREITVSWLKDGKRIDAAQTNIVDFERKETISYRVDSIVEIPLEQGDGKAQLTCQIQHSSLDGPLQQNFQLGEVLLRELHQQSIIALFVVLSLNKVIILLFVSCLFLIKVHRCKKAKDRSRTSRQATQSENSN